MTLPLTDPKNAMKFGILDMRNSKLHTASGSAALTALLNGEAASFAAMLASL